MQCYKDLELELVLCHLAHWKGHQSSSLILENSLHLVNMWTVYIQNSNLLLTVGQVGS